MRIAQVCVRFGAPGGAEAHVRHLADHLARRGHDVTVYTSDLYTEVPWKRGGPFDEPPEGVKVKRFPMEVRRKPLRYIAMRGVREALEADAPDVLHAHSHRYDHVKRTGYAARRLGRPFCVTPHFHPIEDAEPRWKHAAAWVSDRLDRYRFYRRADRIFTVTDREKAFVEHLAPGVPLVTIPNGIDVAAWRGDHGVAGFRRKHTDGRDYVLYAGRLASNKGLTHLVDAWSRLAGDHPDVDLVLLGKDWGLGDVLAARARDRGLAGRVRFLGHVDGATFRAAVAGCRLFVLPSEWEAFGIVLLEAMAVARPVVATRVGGVPSVVDHEEDGLLVPYGDPAALAAAMGRVLADDELARRLGDAGARKAPRYDWSRVVDLLEDQYQEILRSA